MESGAWRIPLRTDVYNPSTDASLFSTSLPALPREKYSELGAKSIEDVRPNLHMLRQELEYKNPLEVGGAKSSGSILPDDENELLAGIMDDFDLSGLPNQLEDLEEYDIFGSGGGMELDYDSQEILSVAMSKISLFDGASGNGSNESGLLNGVGAVVGEHPFGEHPSRTLFVRNINSNIEDSELTTLFEQYGDIRTLYTACKHRGFVMISYYDIRAARNAMRALQNKPLRRRKLDIHFSIPKDNPSDKDVNQGTLVVFNLDPSVSNEELLHIFGAYGEVKEIRETPHKRNHKFIEYYDVRAAEAALRSLNRSDIAGKRIKLEPSRPGGSRRNLIQQVSPELEQDDTKSLQHQVGSPNTSSPPGNWIQFCNAFDQYPLEILSHSPDLGTSNIRTSNHLPGLASILPPVVSKPAKIAPIGKDPGRVSHMDQVFNSKSSIFQHSHSVPESTLRAFPGNMSPFGPVASHASGIGASPRSQFLWGTSPPYSENTTSSARSSPSTGYPFAPSGQGIGIPSSRYGPPYGLPHHHYQHHIGSAPSGVALERNLGYFHEPPETSFMNSVSYGGMGLSPNDSNFIASMGAHTAMIGGNSFPGILFDGGPPSSRGLPSPRLDPMFLAGGPYLGPGTKGIYRWMERRSRRFENNGNPLDNKKHYQLDLDKIVSGEDTRTTLMIKNIPNKYTSKMLLAVIDESHRGTYDFIYLPIDFKNKCNVGYAFINMVSPSHIISFYQAFNGKKWEKFNSEKVAVLAYARIQGKAALVTHFQNSSLMNEDKRCRPILFHLENGKSGDQEALFNNINIRVRQPDGSYLGYPPESLSDEADEN